MIKCSDEDGGEGIGLQAGSGESCDEVSGWQSGMTVGFDMVIYAVRSVPLPDSAVKLGVSKVTGVALPDSAVNFGASKVAGAVLRGWGEARHFLPSSDGDCGFRLPPSLPCWSRWEAYESERSSGWGCGAGVVFCFSSGGLLGSFSS
jgi:hypothetical protein